MKLKKFFKNLKWYFGAANVINNFPDGIVFVNSDGYITQMNRKAGEMFIISDGVNPVRFNKIIPDGMNAVKTSIRLKKPVLTQADVYDHKFYVELMASKKNNEFCISLRNKTQLTNDRDTELKIDKFNNEKNAMLVKLQSEIKSPIESITGFTKGLIDGLGGELTEKQAKYIKIINNNANDLDEFVNELLEFTYAESLLYKPEIKKFDVVAEAKEIIKDLECKFTAKNVEFNFDYSLVEQRSMYSDINAYKSIIKDILHSSLEMTENGTISMTLSPVDAESSLSFGLQEGKQYLQINIMDSGVGVEPNEIRTLCDPYFQADKGKKNLLRALRLGTASILVKRCDGFVDISSELMRGTIYNVVIPIEKDTDE